MSEPMTEETLAELEHRLGRHPERWITHKEGLALIAEVRRLRGAVEDSHRCQDPLLRENARLRSDLANSQVRLGNRCDELCEALEGCAYQFAIRLKEPARCWTGGLSALEEAFEALGWDDPHPIEEKM